MTQYNNPNYGTPASRTDVVVTTGTFDRVRWGAIVAGLFVAMSVMVLLSVLGMAIGLSAYDQGDNPRAFSTGMGIWAIISAIIAFFIGGWFAARTAGVEGRRNGMINGLMVWAVAVPLSLYLLSGGVMNVLSTGGRIADERVMRAAVNMPQQGGANLNNVNAERAKDTASSAAWWTLVSLLVGLGCAALGGQVGSRYDDYRRDHTTTTTATGGTTGTTV
jgi:hypothetical protein